MWRQLFTMIFTFYFTSVLQISTGCGFSCQKTPKLQAHCTTQVCFYFLLGFTTVIHIPGSCFVLKWDEKTDLLWDKSPWLKDKLCLWVGQSRVYSSDFDIQSAWAQQKDWEVRASHLSAPLTCLPSVFISI